MRVNYLLRQKFQYQVSDYKLQDVYWKIDSTLRGQRERPRFMGSTTSLTCWLVTGPYSTPVKSIPFFTSSFFLRYSFTLFSVIGICLQAFHLTYKKLRLICPLALLLSTPWRHMAQWTNAERYPFLTSTLGGKKCSALRPDHFTPGDKAQVSIQ